MAVQPMMTAPISEDGEGVRCFNVRFTCGAWAAKETP